MHEAETEPTGLSSRRAGLYVAPFVLLGLADIVLLLWWGIDPLWGFVVFPPIVFISVLGWIAFQSGFISDRTT